MQSGRFRHQVQLLRRVDTQLPGGQVRHSYAPIAGGLVWARIAAISGREFFAAAQIQSETTTRITIRWRDDIDETCRVRHVTDHSVSPPRFDDYDIKAVIPDEKSGRRELVLMCAKSPAEGWRNTVVTGSGEPLPPPEFTISWSQITDVPTEFPPSAHTHGWGDLTGVPATFPPSAHTHDWGDLTGVPVSFPPSAHTHDWGDLTGVPVSFPPSSHTHDWGDLTSVPATFPPSAHTHSHGALSDLGADDHAQYILVNGTRPFTGTQTTRALQPSATTTYDLGSTGMRYRTTYTRMLSAFAGTGSSTVGNNSSMAAFAQQTGAGSATVTSQSAYPSGSAFVAGAARALGGGTVTLSSIGLGSVAFGDAVTVGGGDASLSAAGLGGCLAVGSAVTYTSGSAEVNAATAGSVAFGYASATDGFSASISATGFGSVAFGSAVTDSADAVVEATNDSAVAFGGSLGGTVRASGIASHVVGEAVGGYELTASGEGSAAFGAALTDDIIASATNSVQFGQGINAVADSVRVGNAGLHLKGTVGAFGSLANGQIWVDASGIVNIRSGGNTIQIT